MRFQPSKPALLAAGIALTVVALFAQEVVPARTVDLLAPGAVSNMFLMTPGDAAGQPPPTEWLDADTLHWRCSYATAGNYQPCGVTFVLTGDDASQGRDLSRFDAVEMDLHYDGSAHFVRLAIRNFDPRFSKLEDGNSARMQSVNLRQRDIKGPVRLELGELTVPEWWVQQFDLAREYNRPSLENVTTLSIDVPGQLAGQVHEMQLRRLVLKGQWVSHSQVYLAILCIWLGVASGVALQGWHRLRQGYHRQQREIDALTARTRVLRVEQDKLRRLATIDELTGVLNRRGVEQALGDLEDKGRGLTLLMLDIDHFKRVNDRHGHDRGDEVLRRVAAVVAANLRGSDVFGRWGGEEFLVACPGMRVRDAARLAEKLRERVQASEISMPSGRLSVTASFGVAVAPPGSATADALKRADEALYRAKEAGRNRVEVDESVRSDAPTTV